MLIVFEGIHGSGKSTLLNNLKVYIENNINCKIGVTSWNSYPDVEQLNTVLKTKGYLNALNASLIHALDFNLRYEYHIKPLLQEGYIILADRYIYTAYVRDQLRGIPREMLDVMYNYASIPDIVFYFDINPVDAINRMISKIHERSSYILGLDLKLANNPIDNFRIFLQNQRNEYEKIVRVNNSIFYRVDTSKNEKYQTQEIIDYFINIYNSRNEQVENQ
ncbi:MAG: hypothetical protein WBL93_08185 [Lutisporaceae bacterium]